MQQSIHPLYKKAAAAALMALLLFILVGKALHTHNAVDALKINTHTASFQYACSICDYQLAKDADSYTFSFQLVTPQQQSSSYSSYIIHQVVAHRTYAQLRGPPAFNI